MSDIIIKSINPIENEPLFCLTVEYVSGGERKTEKLIVFTEYCRENGIKRGTTDENVLAALRDNAKLCVAVRRGESLLSYGSNSKEQLVRKLKMRKIEDSYARRATDLLAERGYINDRECALCEAEKCVKKLWGERRILAYVSSRGYKDESLNEVHAYLEDVDFLSLCTELINKRYQGALSFDKKEGERAVAALIRYGYSQGTIKAAIQKCRKKYFED